MLKAQYIIRVINDEGEVKKEVSGTKDIPAILKGEATDALELYAHVKAGKSPYKKMVTLSGISKIE
jgi:hypothetical protein